LEIDERYDPNNEFLDVEIDKNSLQRSESDVSDTFLEMDKYMKERFKYVLRNKTGPNSTNNKVENIKLLQELNENVVKLKYEQKQLELLDA
jgi:stress response protein YsnF